MTSFSFGGRAARRNGFMQIHFDDEQWLSKSRLSQLDARFFRRSFLLRALSNVSEVRLFAVETRKGKKREKKNGERFSCRDLEIFSLIIGTLCHDLDHRGTNNAYQVSSVSTKRR